MAGANPLGIIEGLLNVEEKIGGFIKGDVGGDSAIANHFRDQYRARCEEFTNAPGWVQGFVGLGAGGAISRICKPYLDDNEWDLPEVDQPLTGGQCEGVNYSFTVGGFYTSPEGNVPVSVEANCSSSSSNNGPGPISLEQNVPGQFNTIRARIRFGDNTTRVFLTTTADTTEHFLTATAVRCDGQPDDCGDPAPVPTPGPNPAPMPDPVRLPGDEPRPNPRNPGGLPDIPVDPFPDPFGGPGFPALPDGFGFGGGRSGGGGAGRNFDPIDNDDETGGQDEDFDDPPEGEVWVGAYLELTKVPTNITNVPGTGPENAAYFRIVGNFSIFSDSNGARLYSDSVTIKNQWTKFIGNPQGLPVSGARVSVLPGVRYRVIPVSAPADPDRNGEE